MPLLPDLPFWADLLIFHASAVTIWIAVLVRYGLGIAGLVARPH